MAASPVGLSLQSAAASDGLIERFRFGPIPPTKGGSVPVVTFSREALDLALHAAQSLAMGLVEDLQRELRKEAEALSPPLAFSVTPPALKVHDSIVQLPGDIRVFLRYSEGLLVLDAPELKIHGSGETVSEAIEEMSEHLEGLVDHYRNLGPDKLTPGGQRVKAKLLSLPGL